MKKIILFALIAAIVTGQANALVEIVAKVTVVEATYLPGDVAFQLDTGTSTLPAGTWLHWKKTDENNKAVYGLLMSALMSGKSIRVYFNDSATSTNAYGEYIHLLQ